MSFPLAVVGAAFLSWVLCRLVLAAGPVDRPRARGTHDRATVTSGGVAIVVATAVATGWAAQGLHLGSPAAAWSLALAAILAMAGLIDDVIDLGALTKLGLQLGLALGFAAFARVQALPVAGAVVPLGAVLGALGSVAWIVLAANAVNFVDGANGVAAGGAAFAFAAFAAAAHGGGADDLALLAGCAAAANLGFLGWNMAGRLFQGDAGALFSGFLLGALAVVGAGPSSVGPVSPYVLPTALAPILTDVLVTLALRASRRERLFEAHRSHLYHRWLEALGGSHLRLALRVWAIEAAFALAALGVAAAPPRLQTAAFLLSAFVSLSGWIVLDRRLRPA